jgi:hypothetical protein
MDRGLGEFEFALKTNYDRASSVRFGDSLFESLGVSIRDFPGFFVLVLRVSSTRAR